MKKAVFWDVTPCKNCVNRRFEERIASIFRVEDKKKFASEPAEQVQQTVPAGNTTPIT
jgi:deoxycytidylate deaminase